MKGKRPIPDPNGYFSYTVELRDTGRYGFVLPPAQIIPTGEENYQAALFMAHYVLNEMK